ncbi:MAG: DegQ family serine endoprotease [Alcanivoracaceae bacterium]
MKIRARHSAALIAGLWIMAQAALAALPGAIADGQPLPSLAPMLDRAMPAVVNIATQGRVRTQNPLMEDPFFRRFFNMPNMPQERRTTSAGSGVIVDARLGYVLTNAHVVRNAEQIEITLIDGRTLEAELVGMDSEVDLAVLKVPANGLSQMPIADSSTLRVGDFVVAIGNPFSLGHTVTSGIVSALGRTGLRMDGYENYIQTDASINPGNSGGALVNLRGELVGINTAIIAPAGGNIGIGFAIPTEMTSNIMAQLIQHGEVRRGSLGVNIQDLTAELAEAFGVKADQRGVVITQVVEDSAAEDAGLKAGDVVVAVDGRPVRRAADLRNKVGMSPVGDRITLTLMRDGRERQITAVIRETSQITSDGGSLSKYLNGASIRNLRKGELSHAESGVLVEDVERGSPAARAGLRPGDVIINANRQDIADMDQLRAAIPDKEASILLRLNRNGGMFFVVIR